MQTFDLDVAIRKIPDFPKKGILFYDITSILTNPKAFQYCIDQMCGMYAGARLDAVACVEARGFVFAAPFAYRMGIPLILVRKKGKLPGKTREKHFDLEYGTDVVAIHESDVTSGDHVLIVDDLIATGGTVRVAGELIEEMGGHISGVFGVIGLPFLNFNKMLARYEVKTLIDYASE